MKKFALGDVVIPRTCETILACGSGRYTHAIVASIYPFVMVSEEGDMCWEKEYAEDYMSLCQSHPDIQKVVNARWERELKNYPRSLER